MLFDIGLNISLNLLMVLVLHIDCELESIWLNNVVARSLRELGHHEKWDQIVRCFNVLSPLILRPVDEIVHFGTHLVKLLLSFPDLASGHLRL
jgi:hypothetical protein